MLKDFFLSKSLSGRMLCLIFSYRERKTPTSNGFMTIEWRWLPNGLKNTDAGAKKDTLALLSNSLALPQILEPDGEGEARGGSHPGAT
jgi:hypothetical protein